MFWKGFIFLSANYDYMIGQDTRPATVSNAQNKHFFNSEYVLKYSVQRE